MTEFKFVTNLRPATVDAYAEFGYRPMGWLLSTHRLNAATQTEADEVHDRREILFADNGTKRHIDTVVELFKVPLVDLRHDIAKLRHSLPDGRRAPWPSEVPGSLESRARDAVFEVAEAVDTILDASPTSDVLGRQLLMRPTHLIAKEDFVVASILSLDLERDITALPVAYFNRRNRKTLEYWKEATADQRTKGLDVYATLGSTDYNTARAAARLAAEAGCDRVAVGYAGINGDAVWTQSYFAGGPRRMLPGAAPRRYVRGTCIALGIRDGYRDAGKRLRAFHALGLGAAAQFPGLAASFDWYTEISVDATSPIHDSVNDRVFYDISTSGDRMAVEEIGRLIVEGGDWTCVCPFCSKAIADLGHSPLDARAWWHDAGKPQIQRSDLAPTAPLAETIPAFASGRGSTTSFQNRTRMGNNHWVLDELARSTPTSKRREWALSVMDDLITNRKRSVKYGLMASRLIHDAIGD